MTVPTPTLEGNDVHIVGGSKGSNTSFASTSNVTNNRQTSRSSVRFSSSRNASGIVEEKSRKMTTVNLFASPNTKSPEPKPQKVALQKGEEPSALRRIVSVRTIAAAMCFLLLVATASIILVVTSTFSLSAARDIASQHAVSISNKAKSDIEDYLNIPVRYVHGWQYILSQEEHPLPKDDPNPKWTIPWEQRLIAPMAATNFGFQYSVMGFEDGNNLVGLKLADEKFRMQFYEWGNRNGSDPTQESNLTNTDYHRANYTVSSIARSTTSYDPRSRVWYTMSPPVKNSISWGNVLLSTVPTLPIFNVAASIFNASGVFIGVATLIFDITTVDVFLKQLDTTANSMTFLIDNDGLLVSSSFDQAIMVSTAISANYTGTVDSNCIKSDASNGAAENLIVCRQRASTYGFQPLRQLITEQPALLANGNAGTTSVFELGGERYYVAVVPIETPQADRMGWRFALFLPEDDIIGGIVKGRNLAIYICIGVVGLAVVIALVVITLLLRPLDAVADRMYRVAMMQDVDDSDEEDVDEPTSGTKRAEPSKSVLYEVATIQTAFNTMTAELAKIKSFLPQSVLAQLYGDDDEDDEGDQLIHAKSTMSASRMTDCSRSVSVRGSVVASSHESSASARRQKAAGLNTSVKLSSRKVTMLCMNVVGYHKYMLRKPSDDLARQHAKIVKIVSDVCSEHRGVMDGFQGDRFTISFNAVTNAGSHAVLAAHAAKAASETVLSHTNMIMSSGIANGSATVGNMGSATTKRFTVLSHVVSSAVLLERLSKRYCSSGFPVVLVGGPALQDVNMTFDTLTTDIVLLPAVGGSVKRSRICAVMAPHEAAGDEWMYEVQENDANSRYSAINNAFRLFADGSVDEAGLLVAQLFASVGDSSEEDVLVRKVLSHLDKLIAATPQPGGCYTNPLGDYYTLCALPTHEANEEGGECQGLEK